MRYVAIVAAVFVGALALAMGGPTTEALAKPASKTVVVQSGDTLDTIATAHNSTYKRLFDANDHIAHPDVIYAGDKVRIPAADEELVSRPLPGQAPVATAAVASVTPQVPPSVAPAVASGGDVWDRLAACESGGDWSTNTGNGYSGGLQFSQSSWEGVGGSGSAHQASKGEQIARAEALRTRQGWGAWPACSAKLGLL